MSPPPEVTLQLRRVVDDVRGMVESAAWHASNLKCYNCNEMGHLSRNCLKPKTAATLRAEARRIRPQSSAPSAASAGPMLKKRASKRSASCRKPPWLMRCAASAVMCAGARDASQRVTGTCEIRSHLG